MEAWMTLRTQDTLKCQCGHVGIMKSSENDQPYSSGWSSHKLIGFLGEVTDWKLDLVKCPECGQVGKVEYAKGS
jgi:hypothetical protein